MQSPTIYNPWEQQLSDITQASWDTQYITGEANIQTRSPLCSNRVFGVKLGSWLGRICKFLHLDSIWFVRKLFICGHLPDASIIIKKTIQLISSQTSPLTSALNDTQKQQLITQVACTFNNLIDSVNAKRDPKNQLPASIKITIDLPEKQKISARDKETVVKNNAQKTKEAQDSNLAQQPLRRSRRTRNTTTK